MLKRLLRKILPASPISEPKAKVHTITLENLSRSAENVCSELQKAGFEAYMVGGCIRDSLLGTRPKDFDVATSATPEQVRKVFRSARIIGRRFKIVHVRFGREIIEVTTFRGHHSTGKARDAQQSDDGLLLRDNVYGDLSSDAVRRDFTVNALYYNPIRHELHDFTGGLKDIEARTLRIIGNPEERYREDPVRMLRAARFAAKLGFSIAPETEKPIAELADLLRQIPPARLFEEVLKLMLNGYATATTTTLQNMSLLSPLFPETAALIRQNEFNQKLIEQVCINTDKRIRQNKRVTPAFIFAAFLWLPLQAKTKQLLAQGKKLGEARHSAMSQVIGNQLAATTIPKRFIIPMREIWQLQSGLEQRSKLRIESLLEHPRFRAAYDFLLLREDAGEDLGQVGHWWTEIQQADEDQKTAMIEAIAKPENSKPRRRRRRVSNNES